MKLKTRRKVLLGICLACLLPTLTIFASTKTYQVYNAARNVYANVTITYTNGAVLDYVDFLGYGASVGGEDAQYVTVSNPAKLTIVGSSSGTIVNQESFYYGKSLNNTKGISLFNTYVETTITIDGTTGGPYTLTD